MQGDTEPTHEPWKWKVGGEIKTNIRKIGNSENSNFHPVNFGGYHIQPRKLYPHPTNKGKADEIDLHKSGNELSLDLHKYGNELSLDFHKSSNEFRLGNNINESPMWNSSLLGFFCKSFFCSQIGLFMKLST